MKCNRRVYITASNDYVDKILDNNSKLVDIPSKYDKKISVDRIVDLGDKKFIDIYVCEWELENYIARELVWIHKDNIDVRTYLWCEGGGIDLGTIEYHYFYKNGEVGFIEKNEEMVLGIDDRDKLIEIVKSNNESFGYLSDKYKNDYDFVLEVINSFDMLYLINDEMRMNKDIVFKCLSSYGSNYRPCVSDSDKDLSVLELYLRLADDDLNFCVQGIPKVLFNDREFVFKLMENTKVNFVEVYERLPKELRIDRDIVNKYVNSFGCTIKGLDKSLRDDDELIMKIIDKNPDTIKEAGDKYRNDRGLIERYADRCFPLVVASRELKKDYDFVRWAILNRSYNFYYANKEFRNDKDFVLKLMEKDVFVFQYASEKLRDDEEIVFKAAKQELSALKYASNRIKRDKDFILSLVGYGDEILNYIGLNLRNDKDVMEKILLGYKNYYDIGKELNVLSILGLENVVKYSDGEIYHEYLNCSYGSCLKDYEQLLELDNSELIVMKIPIRYYNDDKIIKYGYLIHPVIVMMGKKLFKDKDYIQYLINIILEKSLPF